MSSQADSDVDPQVVRGLALKANDLRRELVTMFGMAGGGHYGGSLSAAEIIAVLYFDVLRLRPQEPDWPARDRFILSKGHAAPALYAALCDRGFFPRQVLNHFEEPGNPLTMHPNMRKVPGVDASTGSMGHGLPIGVGMCLGARLDGLDFRTYVLMGDGETQEGSVWEAVMCAAHYRLDNLVAIVDRNCLSCDGVIADLQRQEGFAARWEAFGWTVREVDGHSVGDLARALRSAPYQPGRPSVLIAHTVKGKGISFMENAPGYHRANISPEQTQRALAEVAAQRKALR
ncbi:MAG: transketolase [Chloroflexi bacterium RBG_13_68_17]|nr:MAG: transketolase [Chloroflexi bacterium RBG_13_68_17]